MTVPAKNPIRNRHDIIVMFDVVNGNPNGDPDSDNMPRTEPSSNIGLVTDVCLKRKVRNYAMMAGQSQPGLDILIKQGNIIEKIQIQTSEDSDPRTGATGKKAKATDDYSPDDHALRQRDLVCSRYFDVRAFGQVFSTGKDTPLSGHHLGQIRGPVQTTFGTSYHPISILDNTITRGVATKLAKEKKVTKDKKGAKVDESATNADGAESTEMEKQDDRTMGRKYIVPYGLYYAVFMVDPVYAIGSPYLVNGVEVGTTGTGFSQEDYQFLIEAITNLFEHDQSSARPMMTVRGVLDFEHVGHGKHADRGAILGCALRQRLVELLKVKPTSQNPNRYSDFSISVDFDESGTDSRYPGIRLHRHVDPCSWNDLDDSVDQHEATNGKVLITI